MVGREGGHILTPGRRTVRTWRSGQTTSSRGSGNPVLLGDGTGTVREYPAAAELDQAFPSGAFLEKIVETVLRVGRITLSSRSQGPRGRPSGKDRLKLGEKLTEELKQLLQGAPNEEKIRTEFSNDPRWKDVVYEWGIGLAMARAQVGWSVVVVHVRQVPPDALENFIKDLTSDEAQRLEERLNAGQKGMFEYARPKAEAGLKEARRISSRRTLHPARVG